MGKANCILKIKNVLNSISLKIPKLLYPVKYLAHYSAYYVN